MSYDSRAKIAELTTKRAEMVALHGQHTAKVNDLTVGIHQIDGALAILNELEAGAQSPIGDVDGLPRNGVVTPTG